MLFHLAGAQQLAQPVIIDARVVRNGREILDALACQGFDQLFGDSAQSESSNHEHCAILNVTDRLICTANDLIHKHTILISRAGRCKHEFRSETAEPLMRNLRKVQTSQSKLNS